MLCFGERACAQQSCRSDSKGTKAKLRHSIPYIPAGYGHAMVNTGNEDLEIVQTWDAGKFEEITLKHWMATAPKYLLSNNMAGASAEILDKIQAG
jgi:oxalate decarboxylase/phosphoglucose isomerase-like protein (cupin superfamily)